MGSSSNRARRRQKAQESLEREASHSKQVKKQQPDSDTEEEGDHEVMFPPRKREIVVTPPSPSKVLEVPDCGMTSVTNMVKTLNDAIAAVSQDTAQIQRAYQQLRLRLTSYVLQQGDCAALMDHRLTFPVVFPVWCRFWD